MAHTEHPGTQEDPTSELTGSLSATTRALFSAGSATDTLQAVVDLAVKTIDGCDFAGLFVLEGDAVTTPAHTDPVVIAVDALQHRAGEGPCLDAIAQGGAIYAEDLADDARWPGFAAQATSAGIRNVLAFRLCGDGARGSLNLYARYPRAFGVVDRAKGLILAVLAGIALLTAEAHDDDNRRAANLHAALQSREVIGQAEGILIERERITPKQAFDVLRRASQHLNVKLRDVAQRLVDTGENPIRTGIAPG